MSPTDRKWFPFELCPRRRFELDFPLVFWFAGLWFYLKAFLYFCYLYMLGLEPTPYPPHALVEIGYFAVALIPAALLGFALWNEKKRFVIPAIAFLVIDTPLLIFHVYQTAMAGYLDSTLAQVLEFGSLLFNVISLGWLVGYQISRKAVRR
jgi:hypothetical protein